MKTLPTTGIVVVGLVAGSGIASAQNVSVENSAPAIVVDVTAYYLMTDYGADAAFGAFTQITGAGINPNRFSHSIDQRLTAPEGGGVRVSARRMWNSSWFAGAEYSGFFTSETKSLGQTAVDTASFSGALVHANLLDRTLADNAGGAALNDRFDNGFVDFASDSVDLEQHFGDLVLGQRSTGGGPLNGFWHAGMRVANTDVDREVIYQNLEFGTDLDTAQINFKSDMWGVGPTVGGGVTVSLPHGLSLATSASASALYADFDLSRRDAYTDASQGSTEVREVSLDTQEIVPVFDASVELKKQFGAFHASFGYTMSAWLGGARSLNINGFDNNDENTTPYSVKSDNIITHGVYARAGLRFGGVEADPGPSLLAAGLTGTSIDVTGYYLMTDYGTDPAFGLIEPITGPGIDTDSHSISEQLTDPEGGGIRVSARQRIGPTWFAGAEYTGFFTEQRSSIGNPSADSDNVHTGLLDRTLANQAINLAAGTFEEGVVDFASETIDIEQHFGDLVLGQRSTVGGPLGGFWHTGLRVANTNVDRLVLYENEEPAASPDNATATIDFKSDMWGVGPTVGGGLTLAVTPRLSIAASASASALYADFDLSRRDTYFNAQTGLTEIRAVSLDTQEIVPVFDASVELKKTFGNFHASLGYTMSAWLGGARRIATNGSDDNLDLSSTYSIKSDNIITHGVFARAGLLFGDVEANQGPSTLGGGLAGITIDIAGYYLMTDFGANAAFGAINSVPGFNPDSVSTPLSLTDPEGGGVRVSARRTFGSSWFAGAAYTGFFTEENSNIGNAAIDGDGVFANLIDRTLADNAGLSENLDDGIADFASDTINLEQHFADLVLGQRSNGSGPLSGFWHAGLRVANTEVDRDVLYQNQEPAAGLDSAQIDFKSDMWGVGPTVGGGVTLSLPQGFALATSASASALYADFDVSRRDSYFNPRRGRTEIREVLLNTQDVVPVVDASVELKKSFGKVFASVGYTVSAWLGGARSIAVDGWDDIEDDTSAYVVESNNVIIHGVSARLGIKFGASE